MENTSKFIGNFILRGKFECMTGLHIGGSKEKLEIGGVDSPVIRDPRTRYPYVPGSSLKGKLRSLLEFALGVVPLEKNEERKINAGDVSDAPDIVRLFGIGVDLKEMDQNDTNAKLYRIGPSRLIVRDCHPDMDTIKWWKTLDTDLLYTEYKSENGINRITSAANPRFIERVVKGSKFEFELIYTVYDVQKPNAELEADIKTDLENLRMALLLLEHNFLGKSGSRGYGRIKFGFAEPVWMSKNDYINPNGQLTRSRAELPKKFEDLKPIDGISWEIGSLS
jgi:CRISPR-associated protein Csm3